MIKKKGKQKYILYLMRRQRKILRARQRHKKKTFNSKGHCIPQEENFLGRDPKRLKQFIYRKYFQYLKMQKMS